MSINVNLGSTIVEMVNQAYLGDVEGAKKLLKENIVELVSKSIKEGSDLRSRYGRGINEGKDYTTVVIDHKKKVIETILDDFKNLSPEAMAQKIALVALSRPQL